MRGVVGCVTNPMLIEPRSPDRAAKPRLFASTKRESALDELHRFFKRNIGRRRYQQMDMVGHEGEFMHLHPLLSSVGADYIEQKLAKLVRLQNESSLEGRKGNEECSDFLWCENQG